MYNDNIPESYVASYNMWVGDEEVVIENETEEQDMGYLTQGDLKKVQKAVSLEPESRKCLNPLCGRGLPLRLTRIQRNSNNIKLYCDKMCREEHTMFKMNQKNIQIEKEQAERKRIYNMKWD